MDPFLEDPTLWTDFHSRLITVISDRLTERIAPAFLVRIEQRVYITLPDDAMRQQIVPDLYLVRNPQRLTIGERTESITTPTLVEPLYEEEVHERYLEIYDARSHEVVTTIEILSPFNKAMGSQGHTAFLRKRQAVLQSQTHWIEIDLLRGGKRPLEVATQSDYYALLKRGDRVGPFEVWYINLRDRLPTIAVPLRAPDADAPLDLQAVVETVYTRAYYAASVDYTAPVPMPHLNRADAAWAGAQVQAWQAHYSTGTA